MDPGRSYRVRVWPGDAVYLSLTVYGGPDDGHYSDRIVGSLNSRQAAAGADGTIEMVLAPEAPEDGTPWIKLEPDAVCAITRDYLTDPRTGSGPAGRSPRRTRPCASSRLTPIWPGACGPP